MNFDFVTNATTKELEQFKSICNQLLSRTYIVRTTYQPGKGRVDNPDYLFLSRHYEAVQEYLSLLEGKQVYCVQGQRLEEGDSFYDNAVNQAVREVLEQALRYNLVLNVKYVVITNGLKTFGFARDGESYSQMKTFPDWETMQK